MVNQLASWIKVYKCKSVNQIGKNMLFYVQHIDITEKLNKQVILKWEIRLKKSTQSSGLEGKGHM